MIKRLPISQDFLRNNRDELCIDMSSPLFSVDVTDDANMHAAMIFVRNASLSNLTFENCDYTEKEYYLLEYLTGDIIVDIPLLTMTWVHITSEPWIRFEDNIQCILTENELKQFKERNKKLIYEVYRFMVSMPICAENYFFVTDAIRHNKEYSHNFTTTDFDGFNMYNLTTLFRYDDFLVGTLDESDHIEPVFYNKYFYYSKDDVTNPWMRIFITKLPYNSLLDFWVNGNHNAVNDFMSALDGFMMDMINDMNQEEDNGADNQTNCEM